MRKVSKRKLTALERFNTEVEEIFSEICDGYCRYVIDSTDIDKTTGFPKHCKTCPMNKL
jgi:hypothetical protein